jgi:hypothetical protein
MNIYLIPGLGFDQRVFSKLDLKQSNHYLQWALKTLSAWQGAALTDRTEIIQISGALDKTFPMKLMDKPTYTIEDGAHFMVYRKASIINEIIHAVLENSTPKF